MGSVRRGKQQCKKRAQSRGVEIDKTKKGEEIVRALVGSMTEEADIVVACDSKSKLWKDVDLKSAMQNWNMKYVGIARSPESALRVGTSSERLAIQMKISETTEMDAPRIGKLVQKSEMGDPKVGTRKLESWKKIQKLGDRQGVIQRNA